MGTPEATTEFSMNSSVRHVSTEIKLRDNKEVTIAELVKMLEHQESAFLSPAPVREHLFVETIVIRGTSLFADFRVYRPKQSFPGMTRESVAAEVRQNISKSALLSSERIAEIMS